MSGLLIVLSGPSGAGKGSICKSFLEKHPEIHLSVSATTRQPREGEVDGVSYYFVNKSEFENMISSKQLLEYACVFDNYYGTPKQKVLDLLSQGKDVILEIDVQGALQVKEEYPEGLFVFILPPSLTELRSRIIKRGSESPESLSKRFGKAKEEMEVIFKYDYFIVNDTLTDAVCKLESILVAEKCRIGSSINKMLSKIKEECDV